MVRSHNFPLNSISSFNAVLLYFCCVCIVCLCMTVCAQGVCTCVCVSVCVPGGPSECLPLLFFMLYFEMESLTDVGTSRSSRVTGQHVLGNCLSPPPPSSSARVTDAQPCWDRDLNSGPILCIRYFIHQIILHL